MRITIGRKIGSGFGLLGILLVLCGVTGYWVEVKLTDALRFITGPVMETADTVTAGIDGVQRQLIAVDRVMRGTPDATADLEAAIATTAEAYRRIQKSGLLEAQDMQRLEKHTSSFDAARRSLLGTHADSLSTRQTWEENVAIFQDFLIEMEKQASQHILEVQMKETASSEAEDEINAARDSINAATEAQLALLTRQYQFRRLLDDPQNDELAQQMKVALEDLSYAVEMAGDPEIFAKVLDRGDFQGNSYRDILKQLLAQHEQLTQNAIERYLSSLRAWEAYRRSANELETLGAQIDQRSRAIMESEVAAMESTAIAGARTIWASLIVGLLVALGVSIMALRTIAHPICQVLAQLQAVAEGDGDLTVKLEVNGRDEVADLAHAFNGFTAKLRDIILQLQQSVHRLGASTDDISRVAERTGAEVRRQQEDIAGIAVAVDDLSTNVQTVAADTRQAAQQAHTANGAVDEGQRIVDETRNLTERLSAEVVQAAEVVHRLGLEGERIGGVLDVIRAISEQTNLLALNAAIEAARAGEHGRGFAVVADEVRNLAARTHDSTNEIRDMIGRLQQGIKEAVQVMMESSETSHVSVEHAARTDGALNAIRDAVAAISNLNGHIAEVSEKQTLSANAVNLSVGNISQVARSTVDDAAELSRSTEDLLHLAEELGSIAGRFKT
jgi:methyl-accepting chemotaxis protein